VAALSGPKANEFLRKVQNAAAGPPWYSHEKPVVNTACSLRVCESCYQACYQVLLIQDQDQDSGVHEQNQLKSLRLEHSHLKQRPSLEKPRLRSVPC